MNIQERREVTKEITERVKEIFRRHIGEDNAINGLSLFEEVFGSSKGLDSYIIFYWMSFLNVIIRKLRKDEMFIIKKYGKFFVLQTEREANYYKGVIDRDICNLRGAKTRADDWVLEERWREI